MGNAESSSESHNRNNDNEEGNNISRWFGQKDEKETDEGESSSNKFSSALKVGAAVAGGAALWVLGAHKFSSALKVGAAAGGAALLALGALSLGSQSQELEPHVSTEVQYESNCSPITRRTKIKIMSYNVWSREEVKVEERIEAIGNLVQEHSPNIIFFQELSKPEIRKFMSMRFKHSSKGKRLVGAQIEIEIGSNKTVLTVATSHLKSPNPPKNMYTEKRVSQAKEALLFLRKYPNVIFGGDMNWDEDIDGVFPLQGVWKDAWTELRGGEDGWTFDTKSNAMLRGNFFLQKRLDRFICRLEDCSMMNVEMIGKKPIPGISYSKNRGKPLPVLPSDHYGLILTISDNV